MSKVSIDDLKRIILEEALSLSEYVAKGADMSSDAEAFDDPKKLKKMRDEAAEAIAKLPVDHPDLAAHVERLEGLLAGAQSEQDLRAVKDAADIWHNRARRLMKWINRGEYEESEDMTEGQRSKKDGSRRREYLKGVLDHIITADASDVAHEAWPGGGDEVLNLVNPVDHAKRQSGIDTTDADDPSEVMPVAALEESIGDMSKSLASNTRYTPADHLVRNTFSKMTSLADALVENFETVDSVVRSLEGFAATSLDLNPELAKKTVNDWINGADNPELDRYLETISALDKEGLKKNLMNPEIEAARDMDEGHPEEYHEEPLQMTNESTNKWLTIAGINEDN